MIDRQAILPLALGLLIALVGHLALSAEVARWTRAADAPPVERPEAPDPAVDTLTAPRLVEVGEAFEARSVVVNRGRRAVSPTVLQWSVNDQPLKPPTTLPGLTPGESHDTSRRLSFDQPGPYQLAVSLDPAGEADDRDRTNNRRTITLLAYDPAAAEAAKPDLVPLSIEPVGPLFAGRPAKLLARIANRGAAPAESFAIELELDGLPVATAVIDQPLPSGRVAVRRLELRVDQTGPREVCLLADPSRTVDELDEQNNRRCFELNWRSIDSKQPAGQLDPPDQPTVNWISYEAFQAMRATQESTQDQPLVQKSTDPAPVDRAPIRATPPAPQPSDATAGVQSPDPRQAAAAPTSPAEAQAAPERAAAPTPDTESTDAKAEPNASAQTPTEPKPKATPELPELPRGELARAPREAPADPSTRIEPTPETSDVPRLVVQPDAATASPSDAVPEALPEDQRTKLENPPLKIEQAPLGGAMPRPVDALPPSERAELRARPLPDAAPEPAEATRPVEAAPTDPPDTAAVALEPRPAEPAAAPEPADPPSPDKDRAPASPDAPAEDQTRPNESAASEQPRQTIDRQRSPAQRADADAPPSGGPTGRPSNPTAAPRDQREAQPASRITDLVVQPGTVVARKGIRINTVAPDFSVPTRLTAVPRSPIFNVHFNARGKVVEVETLRSTGHAGVDSPLLIALYKWTAEGNLADDGFLLERLRIRFGRDDRADEDAEEQSDAPRDDAAPSDADAADDDRS